MSDAGDERRKVRLTVDVSPERHARLVQLSERLGVGKSDVVRSAVKLYEYVVKSVLDGHKLSVSRDGVSETLVLLDLPVPEDEVAPADPSDPP